eukprot:1148443-Pelagomonas_calceolata.AAC.1
MKTLPASSLMIKKRKKTQAEETLPTSIKERGHIGSKSHEPPSPEGRREASVGPVDFWQHAAPGHQSYVECLWILMARSVEGMGSIDSPTHTQEVCVERDLSTL